MSGTAAVVRSLLDALRNAGHDNEAIQLEREFKARGWEVDITDQLRLIERLQTLSSTPAPQSERPPPEPAPSRPALFTAPIPPLPPPPSQFQHFHTLCPWVATFPGGWRFVVDTHALFIAGTVPELCESLTRTFVDHLGFEPSPIDETHRLGTQRTLTEIRAVARHEDFFVMAVASTYAGYHTTSFEAVFQLHPRCIIVALERGSRIRVVTRRPSTGTTKLIGQRILRGRGQRAFPDDDVFVWAVRLAGLEPHNHDDGRALALRADDLLRKSAGALLRNWTSAPVDPSSVPGPSWDASSPEELDRFLQADASTRIVYGLDAELRSSFPWSTRDGRVELRCRGYRVVDIERDPDHAEAHAQTLSATVEIDLELHLNVDDASTPSTTFRLPAAIAIPDQHGVFVIQGSRFTFVPGAHQPTPNHSVNRGDEFELDDETSGDDFEVEAEAEETVGTEEDAATPSEPDPEEDVDAQANVYPGEGLVPLLRWAVGRHLRALGASFSKSNVDRLRTPAQVLAWFGRRSDARSRLQLSARSVLLRYLEPAPADRLRTIAVDPFSLPPTWACLELARKLKPGRAYPVAGARIGPGGVLCAPVIDAKGHVRLQSGTSHEAHGNPRATGNGETAALTLWIASPLEHFASLPVGALAHPLAIACLSTPWVGNVFTDGDLADVLRIAPESLSPARRRRRWIFDVPRHPDVKRPPSAVVGSGQLVEVGDPIAVFDHPWVDVLANTHELVHVGREIIEQKADHALGVERKQQKQANRAEQPQQEPPAQRAPEVKTPARTILRCPPGARGRVEEILVVPIVDRRGIVTRYRITLATSISIQPEHAVLADGRHVRLQLCGKEDLPWNPEDGQTVDAMLSTAEAGSPPSASSNALWVDGRTGESTSGAVSLQTIAIIPAEPAAPPDPCLRYRVIDGWGHPRTPSDPRISMQVLRQYVSEHPEAAELFHAVLRQVHGQPSSANSIFELCRASRVLPPAYIPRDWQPTEEAPAGSYDPVRTRIHRRSGAPYTAEHGPWGWTCDCGALIGAKQAQVSCATCETTVKRRWIGARPTAISLPFPVLHPWRKQLVGGLLGLLGDEFGRVTRQHDCSSLFEPTLAALADPTRNLSTRIARCSDGSLKVQLTAELAALEIANSRGLELEQLWISELDVLSPRLLFDGYRSGAPDLLASPLTRAYRQIQGLAQVQVGTNATMRRAAWVELQRNVDALFGEFEDINPPAGTLAALWRRIWPTTAPGHLQVSVPGLFERCNARELRSSPVAQLLASSLPSTDTSWELGLLTEDGVQPLPLPSSVSAQPTDADAWCERAAWTRCSGPLLVQLAALCLGIDAHPSIVAALGALPGASALDGVSRIGPLLLRELLQRIRPPLGRPSVLLGVLEATERSFLARDSAEAATQVEARLEPAIPGDELGALLVRVALARALTGFWCGRPTVQCPHQWVWSPHADDAPSRFRRAIPPLSSTAWRAWPGFELMTNPVAAALGGWAWDTIGGYQPWFGLPGPELLLAVDLTVPTVTDVASDTAEALVAAAPSPLDPEARVLRISLGQWILYHTTRRDHADR
jgi:hypothetical protein